MAMISYDTPFPVSGSAAAAATHTYETPLDRPSRPFVTISCDDIVNGRDTQVIANHTRSGSNTEASLYEEPLVSVPQYDSILGSQVRRGGGRVENFIVELVATLFTHCLLVGSSSYKS